MRAYLFIEAPAQLSWATVIFTVSQQSGECGVLKYR